ncbi:MAG: nucleoside-diphosphate kinase [Armatimonadetes bacterium]|nr:nucleoside-diphosphate kinase [Armatimonadota bacterium]MDE2206764.1 nucleoside-diphosphate kinase [Armatimonadota bacterium]
MQRTFVMVKPDGVQRRLAGEILRRFESRGLRIVGLKQLVPNRQLAEAHYAIHASRPFYGELVQFIISGPVVAMVLEGTEAIALCRTMIGATKPLDALPGTIRGDFTTELKANLVHGSDSELSAKTEIALWFRPEELLPE